MNHLTNITNIEEVISKNHLCLFYIKAPDCGVCNVMLSKVERLVENYPQLLSFYTDITEEPLIASRFLVYAGPTVLLMLYIMCNVYNADLFHLVFLTPKVGIKNNIKATRG